MLNSIDHWSQIGKYKYLIRQLLKVHLITDYKKSFIGWAWLVVVPLFAILAWILLNQAKILAPGDLEIPYPAYVLLSTFIWGFFAGCYNQVSKVLVTNNRFLIMAAVPIPVFVIAKVLVHLVLFSIPLVLNLAILILFGVTFGWWSWLFPVTLIPLLLFGVAIGLFVAIFRVIAPDLARVVDEFLKFWMFLTPIVYTPKVEISWLSTIVDYNPLTYLIGFARDILTKGEFIDTSSYLLTSAAVFIIFLLAILFFQTRSRVVLERMIQN